MIGFYDEYEKLYQIYLRELSNHDIDKILDVGCGNGSFLLQLQEKYSSCGIDISPKMVEVAKEKGVDATCKYIEEVDEKFGAIVAVADVLNYLDKSALESFFKGISSSLEDGGVFICDINTLFGFEEVTAGSMSVDEDDKFLSIEADFDDNVLVTDITLFEKNGECYKKEQSSIIQYYYPSSYIETITDLTLVKVEDIKLFGDEADKTLLTFKKHS
jgi:SAM-dependent methyltransferase